MSTLLDQARHRMPRFAEAAVERARLTVVPRPSIGRADAARLPFVALLSLLLVGGVAGLLFLNTSMQQTSFTATALEQRASLLAAQQQSLQMQLDSLRNPQRVAGEAKKLGMVPLASPAFIRLSDGKVLGDPLPATRDDVFRITAQPTAKPAGLVSAPITVRAPGAAAAARATAADTKKASPVTGAHTRRTTR